MTPTDVQFMEAVDTNDQMPSYPHRMLLLRPELVEIFFEQKYRMHLRDVTAKVHLFMFILSICLDCGGKQGRV